MEATIRQRVLRSLALLVIGSVGTAILTLDPVGAFTSATYLLMFGAMLAWTVVENALLRQDEPKDYAAKRQTRVMQGTVMLGIFVGVVDAWHLGPLVPGSWALTAAGLAILAAGAVVRFVAIRTLDKHFSYELRIEQGHEVVQRGIYRVLRHPSYLGILLITIGAPLIVQSVLGALVGGLVMLGVVAWRISTEEAMLLDAFGDEYAAYSKRSWRIVPFVY